MSDHITPFAETNFRHEKKRFGIKDDDRRRHIYVIGKTGMGKTELLLNMAYDDIMSGKGVCFVDPHGDSAERLVDCVPSHRINDVIYFNPADLEFPIAFNILEKVDPKYRHLVASGLIGVFKKIWADSWGPRLEYLLRNTILALLDYPDSTLLGVNRLLVDKEYRKKVIAKVQDPMVKSFWNDEFTKYSQQFMVEAISPIQNKVGQFLSTGLIRNIIGQVTSTIDLREIMDSGKILILNLSKGRIGEDASGLLGAMIITKLQLAAMSRADIPENDRRDFCLYVDEFQNFVTESFANILSEARKYRLDLTLANQYIGQLEINGNLVVRDAIFGNVGTMMCFRVGATDAEFLVREFSPKYTEEDLVNLPKFQIYLKLMIDGVASDPFSANTLPPISRLTGSAEKIVALCRERYATSQEVVEDKIARWAGVETEAMVEKLEKKLAEEAATKMYSEKVDFLKPDEPSSAEPATDTVVHENKAVPVIHLKPAPKPQEEEEHRSGPKDTGIIQIVKCNGCGQKTKINFVPDPKRPVFCKECLKDYRRDQAKKQGPTPARSSAPRSDLSLRDVSGSKTVPFKR